MVKKLKRIALYGVSIIALGACFLTGCNFEQKSALDKEYERKKEMVEVDYIYNNIIINYINIGGLTKEQAKSVLEAKLQEPLGKYKISFYDSGTNEVVKECSYLDFGVQYEIESLVDEAYNYGRTGTLEERYKVVSQLVEQSKSFEFFDRYIYDEAKVNAIVDELAKEIYTMPKEPKAKMNGSKAVITEKGEDGYELDKEKAINAIQSMLDDLTFSKEDVDIFLPITVLKPTCTEQDINKIDSVLGSFSTKYSNGASAQGRNTNMKVAASKINGTLLMPGEVFSTNEHFGSSTAANGYVNAPVIVNGELEDGIGGGVCQVSSTLYNAVLYSELEIVERQNHSLKVGYADYGFDATLAGDYIDFKFKNSTDAPVIVESYLSGKEVVCKIYGHETRSASRNLKFENKLVSSNDTSKKYEVYKYVYEDGVLKDKVKVNTSTYKIKKTQTQAQTTTVAEPTTQATTKEAIVQATTATPEQTQTTTKEQKIIDSGGLVAEPVM